jgi:hypothetical protein
MVEKAKELCEDLITNVKEQYEEFKSRPPRNYGGSGGNYHDRSGGNSHGGSYHGYGGGYNNGHHGGSSGGNSGGHGAHSSQGGAQGAGANATNAQSAADYAAQYAQYYGGQDPYAAYGGYAAYVLCLSFPLVYRWF